MVEKCDVLAIIPARGGSKGIPRKNILYFAGYPLIAYSIIAGLQSNLVTRTVVSTDDEEIAQVAKSWGAEVPFLRPSELAEDNTLDYPVIRHCLDWLQEHEGYQPAVVVQLRPTSPIRPLGCVDAAVQSLLENPGADCVRGVVPSGQNPFKMWTIDAQSGVMKSLLQLEGVQEPYNAPRQALPKVYWQTGHIDAIRTETILDKGSLTGDVILPLMMDSKYTVDIDLPSDWKTSERLIFEGALKFYDPANKRRTMPKKIAYLVLDFDGVLTDNRVWVDQDGRESIASSRSDSLGLEILRHKTGINVFVLSRETNPVVSARCKKLNIPVLQAIKDKKEALARFIKEKNIPLDEIVYVGNDTIDLPIINQVGYFVAPADSHPEVLRQADLILSKPGGHGALRELCDMILTRY